MDADAVLYAAWELGEVRMGHLLIQAVSGTRTPQWWWSCCCQIAGGFTGTGENASLTLARFMTFHRFCVRRWEEAWNRETTAPIAYPIELLAAEATSARNRR